MPHYTKKAQVLFTEEQYRELLAIAQEAQKSLGALLREAAVQVWLREKRRNDKAQAVQALLALEEVPAPANYGQWEEQYLDERSSLRGC